MAKWKRENNTGTIYKMSGDRRKPWAARISSYDENRVPHSKYIGSFKTYEEASAALAKARSGPRNFTKVVTMDELFDILYEKKKRQGLIESSLDAVKTHYNHIKELGNNNFVDLSNSVNIPVVGTIPAGFAMEAVENILEYIDIPADWTKGGKEYVGLKVSGDSMYPLFLDGDTVVIQLQNTAENGDICACYVNGFDATLKRIKLTDNSITLQPENPNYPPITYTHPGEVTIAGKVVEVRRKF